MNEKFSIRFSPFRRGLSKILGSREAEIMELLWKEGELSVAQTHQLLGHRQLAYTTVMTLMKRLWDKGLLQRRLERGAYIYSPSLSREELLSNVARDVVGGLLEELASPAIAQLFQQAVENDDHLLAEMERLIQKYREKKTRLQEDV
ncbi:MAG: BlaI/MecI/CopY family transcriptional regulator [Dehalococcoidia bacterium]|nr:BlaI/MecI/CopY family transcriptional regulator [Dehalococcoidia bacterium]